MKILLIGGTGTISSAITDLLSQAPGIELTLLNRGNTQPPAGVENLRCDITVESEATEQLRNRSFDVVANFIAFKPEQIERDIRLFSGKTKQYIFISSASAYQKPLSNFIITESTPLANPYWQYSRDKIACEQLLMDEYRANGFPVTIIRPSHTYCSTKIPVAVHGKKGSWQVIDRMLKGKPVIVHGDGLSLWAMLYNTDFANAFAGLLGNPHAIGEAVQITADECLTWNSVYSVLGNILGVEPKLLHIASPTLEAENPDLKGSLLGDKAHSVIFDNSKIRWLVPGYAPQVRFDQGARVAVENTLSNPKLQIPDSEFDSWCDKMVEKYSI